MFQVAALAAELLINPAKLVRGNCVIFSDTRSANCKWETMKAPRGIIGVAGAPYFPAPFDAVRNDSSFVIVRGNTQKFYLLASATNLALGGTC